MRDDDLIREVDRRHVIQLFDLFADSKYDPFDLIQAYSTTNSRARADGGSEYHVLKQPINVFNDILRENSPKPAEVLFCIGWQNCIFMSDMRKDCLSVR